MVAARVFAAGLLAAVLFPVPVNAQHADDSVTRANRDAYEWAIKCFVADGHASGLRERAGDPVKAKYYDAKSHEAFDAATRLGSELDIPGAQVTEDFQRIQAHELPPMVTDQSYFLNMAAGCKTLGLM